MDVLDSGDALSTEQALLSPYNTAQFPPTSPENRSKDVAYVFDNGLST